MASESFASGLGDVGRRGRDGNYSAARRAATGTGMGVEERVSVSPRPTCFLLPEPKPFCARLCVPSLPLSSVPRTPGFWAEPVHWVSDLIWGSGWGWSRHRCLLCLPVACSLLVGAASIGGASSTPSKCMHNVSYAQTQVGLALSQRLVSLQRPSLAVGTKPYCRYQGRDPPQSEGL